MKVRVQEWYYCRELTCLDDYGRVNVTLAFDKKNKSIIARKSNPSKGYKELIFYDDVVVYSEW